MSHCTHANAQLVLYRNMGNSDSVIACLSIQTLISLLLIVQLSHLNLSKSLPLYHRMTLSHWNFKLRMPFFCALWLMRAQGKRSSKLSPSVCPLFYNRIDLHLTSGPLILCRCSKYPLNSILFLGHSVYIVLSVWMDRHLAYRRQKCWLQSQFFYALQMLCNNFCDTWN